MKKYKNIIILLIITNIIFIAIICNLLSKNGNIISEKQIIKEMTQSELEEELNNSITNLNAEHTDYMNYIQECKTKISTAITNKGIETEATGTLEEMAENIGKIQTVKIIYLGAGQGASTAPTIDITDICSENEIDYTQLTVDNFYVCLTKAYSKFTDVENSYTCNTTATVSKSYDETTGILTVNCYKNATVGSNKLMARGHWDVYLIV